MSQGEFTVEVTNISPHATEKDIYDFFSFSGAIEHIEMFRSGEYGSTAYVAFREAHALETAVLLSGATIVDQHVCIARWGQYEDTYDMWAMPSWTHEEETVSMEYQVDHFSTTPREAMTFAQDVVKTMLSKGYTLSKDALVKAKSLDESYQVSATAAAKVSELSKRIGLTDKINTGVGAVRSVDEQYNVSQTTKTVASATARTAVAATNSVVNSSYFKAGALWLSGALAKASKAAADLGSDESKN